MVMLLALSGPALAANSNCRTVAGNVICLDPPPATPLAPGQLQALVDQKVSEERTIVQPLAGAVSTTSCSQVIAAAQSANRNDLVPNLRKRCGQ